MNLSMSKSTLTKKITSEKVQRILNETDWKNHERKVEWGMQIPRGHFYDGELAESQNSICFTGKRG